MKSNLKTLKFESEKFENKNNTLKLFKKSVASIMEISWNG